MLRNPAQRTNYTKVVALFPKHTRTDKIYTVNMQTYK